MTKTSKKNLMLWLGVSTAFAAVFGTSAALYFSAGELKNIADKKEYLIRSSTPLTLGGYHFDTSATYGPAGTKTPESLMNTNLIREKTTGETKFEKNPVTGKLEVSKSSISKLSLEMAQEIILTFKTPGGLEHQVVFNSDVAEFVEFSDPNIEKQPTIKLRSHPDDDANKTVHISNSINSYYFDGLLNGKGELDKDGVLIPNINGEFLLSSLGFTVRDDVYWVDSNGDKTSYKVSTKDFYYSYMRTWLFDTNFRRENGGSETLDQYFIKKTSTTSRFTNEKEYPNDYLLSLFGVDSAALRNEEETLKTIKIDGVDKSVFSVSALKGETDLDFTGLVNKAFLNSFLLAGAPSEWIDKIVVEQKGIEYKTDKGMETIGGLAEKFGIYIYGQTRADNLFASAYVPVSAEDNRMIFKKNIHFGNKEFLEETNTLERIIFEHSNSPTFNDQLFNNYFEGTVSEMPYNTLTQEQKIKIFGLEGNDQFAIEKGLLQVKQFNKTSLVQRTLLTTDPRMIKSTESSGYLFNESYAKVMYGSTVEDLKKGTANTAPTFFNGSGFKLRTLLNASINWFTFVNNSTKGLKQLWLNHTAPNARYNSSIDKTPFDFANEVNSIGYFDAAGNKVVTTEAEMKSIFMNNSSSIDEQYKNKGFADIKKQIEKLLDDANITTANPLQWSIVYPYADASSNKIKIDQLNMIVKTIQQLDSKGRLQPVVYVPNNRDEMMAAVNDNRGISDFNGWGYDYEGIGSYIDGISHGKGISLLGAFSLYSDDANKTLQKNSPEFTKLSKAMKVELNPTLPAGLKIEDWINFTNDQNNNLDSTFAAKGYAMGTEFAKFFLGYQNKFSGVKGAQEITDLIVELNIIAGFAMESDISIDDASATSLSLVLSDYLYPTTESGILYLSDIRLGDKDV